MSFEIGQLVGERDRVSEVLGRGGFGITYAADDLRTHTRVAIKQLDLRHVDDWKIVELFEREARVRPASITRAGSSAPPNTQYLTTVIGACGPACLARSRPSCIDGRA